MISLIINDRSMIDFRDADLGWYELYQGSVDVKTVTAGSDSRHILIGGQLISYFILSSEAFCLFGGATPFCYELPWLYARFIRRLRGMGSKEAEKEDARCVHLFQLNCTRLTHVLGFARRYFVLYRAGLLQYSFGPNQPVRDQISLQHAAISTAPGRRDIHIDSNTATFHIKCLCTEDFNMWMAALRSVSRSTLILMRKLIEHFTGNSSSPETRRKRRSVLEGKRVWVCPSQSALLRAWFL